MANTSSYLLIYMLSFFLVAIPQSSIGVLIPFFAEDLGIEETEYSILFMMLSVGNVAACFLYKVLQSRKKLPRHHVVCMIGAVGMAFFCVMMTNTRERLTQCFILSLFGMFVSVLVMTVNICLLLAPPKEEIGFWMSISHGTYGVGALIGPIIVSYMQKGVFVALAVVYALIVPFFYFIQSPQLRQQQESGDKQAKTMRYGSMKLEVLISLAFFILVGIEITIAGWIPSYVVLANISSKQNAARFTSIFWTLSTIFRFVFGWLKQKDSFKFNYLNWGQLATGILSTAAAIWFLPVLSPYLCSILYGITLSQLFPLLLSMPSEFGIRFQDGQISNMMISTTVSSGVFSTPTGMLMKYDINMFYFSLLFFSALLFCCGRMIVTTLAAERSEGGEGKEREMALLEK